MQSMGVPAPPLPQAVALLTVPSLDGWIRSMTITMAPTTGATPARTTTGSDFAVLSRRINGEGLMQRRPAYYLVRLSVVTLMFLGGWTAFFVIGSSWWQLMTAVFLAVTFTQIGL